jgi:hypothetical protein
MSIPLAPLFWSVACIGGGLFFALGRFTEAEFILASFLER